jgi:hypothetical protein
VAWERVIHQTGHEELIASDDTGKTLMSEEEARAWLARKRVSHSEKGWIVADIVNGFIAEKVYVTGAILRKDRTIFIREVV